MKSFYAMTKFKAYLYLTVTLLLCGCGTTDTVMLFVEKPAIPVLVKKEASGTVLLRFVRCDSLPYTIEELTLDFSGTTDIADISHAGIYGLNNKGMIDPANQITGQVRESRKINLKPSFPVDTDTLVLWVGVTLNGPTELSHKIVVNCTSLKTSAGRVKISSDEEKPLRVGVAVRQGMQDGVHTSRIPSIATSNDGTLLALFDARRESARDLQGDMDICLHRSFDGGVTWGPMQTVLDMGTWGGLPEKYNGVSDAGILIDRNTGNILVNGLWMHGALDDNGKWIEGLTEKSTYWIHQWNKKGSQPGFGVKETSQLLITRSSDDGATWSEPLNITSANKRREWWLFCSSSGQGITMRNGTLVFPAQGRDETGESFSTIMWSSDGGETWVTGNPAYHNTTECSVVELGDGSLMLNMRDNRNRGNKEVNGRRVCVTYDMGQTWIEHPSSRKALVEPTCMASIYRHDYTESGEPKNILLFSNPSDHATRDKMTLKVSFDDGMSWPEEYWIMYDHFRSAGYSSITSVDENTIGIFYESSQTHLAFITISLNEILKR